jgi:integrase
VRGLFPSDWADVWGGFLFYLFNKLAACTGMRLGEVVGLRGEFVFDNYINVCGQWTRYGYGDTKTHKERNIPIPALIRFELQKLMDINGRGYLFSENGGERPIERRQVQEGLFIAHGAARRVETVPA